MEALLDELKDVVVVEGAALAEGHAQVDEGEGGGDAAAGDGADGGGPVVCPEEGGAHVGVVQVEDGAGEGGEGRGGRGGDVDYLGGVSGVRGGGEGGLPVGW